MTLTFRSPLTAYVGGCRGNTVGASTTRYISVEGGIPNATEVVQDRVMCAAGTFRWAYIRTGSTQSGTGSLVVTYRKNAADQALTITIAASSTAGVYSDLTNTFTGVAGDTVAVKLVQGLGTSATITGSAVYFHGDEVNWSHPRTMMTGSGGATGVGASTTTYQDFVGSGYFTSEDVRQCIVPISGIVRNLYLRTNSTQSATGSLVCTLRVENADTSLVTTISAGGASGVYYDVNNTATIAAGDRIGLKYVNNATATSATMGAEAVYIYDRFRKPRTALNAGQGNDTVVAGGTEYTAGANGGSWNANEANRLALTSIGGVLRDFYLVSTTAEPASGSVTFTYRVNQVNTSLVITVAAGAAAGTYTDLTNTATCAAGDRLTIRGVKVSTSASCTTRFGIFLTE